MKMLAGMLLSVAAAQAATASVQTSVAADGPAIVVQGIRDPRHSASTYVDKMLPSTFDAQFGRFEEPLCAGTVGLPEKLHAEVLSRIALVAGTAGIPLAEQGCKPNLLIVVVDDKKALIEGMRQKKQAFLYGVGDDRVKKLETMPGPVAAWQISDVIGADGMPLQIDGNGYPRLFTTLPPSRIRSATRKRLIGSIIVVEQRGLVDVSTRQLADFALLRAMAPIPPRQLAAPTASVLSLFDSGLKPADAPQSVTWWDLAFLKALFATRSDLATNLQRHEIRDRMIAEMAKVPTTAQ
jgi:hypothetical protein